MGRKQKTKHEGSTADPCFYQTVEFHEMLPGDLRFAPEIRIEVSVVSECYVLHYFIAWFVSLPRYISPANVNVPCSCFFFVWMRFPTNQGLGQGSSGEQYARRGLQVPNVGGNLVQREQLARPHAPVAPGTALQHIYIYYIHT